MAARKQARRPARRPAIERPRDSRGRWLSKKQIAARAGWATRRRQTKAKAKQRAKVTAAARHGQAAREKTERRLTPAQRARRKRDAARIERQAGRGRISKKGRRAVKRPETSSQTAARSKREPRGVAPPLSIRSRSSRSSRSSTSSGKKSTLKPRQTLTLERKGKSDSLRVQIGIKATLPAGMEPSNRLLYEAIQYRLDHGDDHPNFKTKIIRWQNPGRKRGELRQWRQGNQDDAWATLGPAISAAIARG